MPDSEMRPERKEREARKGIIVLGGDLDSIKGRQLRIKEWERKRKEYMIKEGIFRCNNQFLNSSINH